MFVNGLRYTLLMRRALLSLILLVGCGGPPPDLAPPPLGDPIMAPKNTWIWVDFADSSCDDGSATGIGINITDSPNLLIFLNGGGACWDYLTCFQINAASHGPFQKPQFDAAVAGGLAGTVFDRNVAENPFKNWSYVFVPYCTGDLHAGDNVATYMDNQGNSKTYHHAGHTNVVAYLKRLGATFKSPGKVVVSGSSAGGYGASFNYATVRTYWPAAKSYLLDDSGPALEEDDIPPSYRDAWYANWRLDKLLDPICPDCKTNLALAVKYLIDHYPNDRLSLLSSLQDKTIRSYMLLTAIAFQNAILKVSMDYFDPSSNYRYFFVTGETHTMLGAPANFTSQGVGLWAWLGQLVGDDPVWKSLKP